MVLVLKVRMQLFSLVFTAKLSSYSVAVFYLNDIYLGILSSKKYQLLFFNFFFFIVYNQKSN